MSDERVRWGVTVKLSEAPDSKRIRVSDGENVLWWHYRREAMQMAGRHVDWQEARIVRLARKKKPRVVRRLVHEITPSGTGGWIDSDRAMIERSEFLKHSFGKRVVLILEELADE